MEGQWVQQRRGGQACVTPRPKNGVLCSGRSSGSGPRGAAPPPHMLTSSGGEGAS